MQATLITASPLMRESKILSVGIFGFLVLTTISGLVTTYEAREAIYLFRLIAAGFVLIATIFVVFKLHIPKVVAVALFCYFFGIIYATSAAAISGGLEVSGQYMLVDFVVPLCGIVLFGARFNESVQVFSEKFLNFFLVYAVFALLLTIIFGGVSLQFPPRFIFEVGSDEIGREENYSLGITSFYVLASIAASIGIVRSGISFRGMIYLFLMLLFLFLSVLGGGRGEIVAGILVISFILLRVRRVRLISIGALVFCTVIAFLFDWSFLFESFVALQRFQLIFEGDMSARDILLVNVFELLLDQPLCLFLGCGPGFFQKYYGYGFGFYPHNSIAEAVLIFGFPLFLIAIFFAVYGFYRYCKMVRGGDFFMAFFIYNFFVSLKSGYLLGSWSLVSGVFLFIGIGFFRFSCCNSLNDHLAES